MSPVLQLLKYRQSQYYRKKKVWYWICHWQAQIKDKARIPSSGLFLCGVAWRGSPHSCRCHTGTSTCGPNIHHLFSPSNILRGQGCPLMDRNASKWHFLGKAAFDSYPQIRMTTALFHFPHSLPIILPYLSTYPKVQYQKRFFHIYT